MKKLAMRQAYGAEVLFKAENFPITGSFKLRGALSKLTTQLAEERLITASSGDHGIEAAFASRALSKSLIVVLPAKLERIKSYGVDVILHGTETGLAEQHAQQLVASRDYSYISPYNDIDIIAGQGTIGLEIIEQCNKVDNVFISMGGGGLISGVGSVFKAFSPRTKVYGIAAVNSKALAASVAAGRAVETEHLPTLAEAVAGGIDGDTITLPLATSMIGHIIECEEEDVLETLEALSFDENMIVKDSAALALAGFNKVAQARDLTGQTNVVLLCGANVGPDIIRKAIYSSKES
ncbi:serine racemase, putative [Talaromyces stipitatus ATCC 10500]|uniref:Serine racemase, putative n=1 Tax=Talaromyces stipitatus (strain ATCC 10500 / CBS 375.48 / QM 6759 / NRRL 1006) TaxID=441959 RepID=B8M5A9_TALSN|nr:serine racemase, putative [Talaromyces stipitatus ATCC 10500]EED19715.1 serine racemase, putative [Talaromyces stipitatus ATCC 10500]